jgi:hypothetical protein
MNKMASNIINNTPISLKDKLKRLASKNHDPSRTNLSDITNLAPNLDDITNLAPNLDDITKLVPNLDDISKLAPKLENISKFAHNSGQIISDVSKVFVETGAEVGAIGISTSENAAKVQAITAINALDDLAKSAADIAKNKLPGLIENVKNVTKVVTEGIGEVNNVIDTTTLEMEEVAKNAQISTMMKLRPGLTEEEARNELINKENIEKEEAEKAQQLELENKRIDAKETEAKAREAEAREAKSGGGIGIKKNTLKNIQKGGKMAAKRTQKSIKDFLNSSITSSSILKLIKGGKRSIKRRRYNSGIRTKRQM